MIVHIVLFRPRPDLPPDEAGDLLKAFELALAGIPVIRRALVGRRVVIGRGYEDKMRTDFPYAAVLEFDDVNGLRQYLDHPAHNDVGGAIFAAAEDILVYDFAMEAGPGAAARLDTR